MPELPEVAAHAARLDADYRGHTLTGFTVLNVATLKTVQPSPADAYGHAVESITSRGKYFVMTVGPVAFVIHLMNAGRLVPDVKEARKPRGGMARWRFADVPSLLLTEAGTERRAGVWVVANDATVSATSPLAELGPDADTLDASVLADRLAATDSARIHNWLRDQRNVAGIGRRLANEICHAAKVSPFATTRGLDTDTVGRIAAAINDRIAVSNEFEATQDHMTRSAERAARVHHRAGEPCEVCGDTVRAVEYSNYEVDYCPTCQTNGKILADNTTSKFLR